MPCIGLRPRKLTRTNTAEGHNMGVRLQTTRVLTPASDQNQSNPEPLIDGYVIARSRLNEAWALLVAVVGPLPEVARVQRVLRSRGLAAELALCLPKLRDDRLGAALHGDEFEGPGAGLRAVVRVHADDFRGCMSLALFIRASGRATLAASSKALQGHL